MMTISLKNLPPELEAELNSRAAATGQSVEDVTLQAVLAGLPLTGLDEHLRAVIGTWVEDPEFDAVIADFERIDAEQWP